MKSIEMLADEVHAEHIARLDIPDGDLKPRPFNPSPRPNTALISDAISRKMIKRELERLRKPKTEKA